MRVQILVSVVKLAAVLKEFTTEEQSCVVRLCVCVCERTQRRRIFIKKRFLLRVGSVCRVMRFHLGGKRFAEDEEIETVGGSG
jgi:hypothetical protein